MKLLCVCPNPAIDYTIVVPQITGGETVRGVWSVATTGGKAFNVARFAEGFGVPALTVTWFGELGADLMYALARRDGLRVEASILPGASVRVCPILVPQSGGDVVVVTDAVPSVDGETWSRFVALAARAAVGADAVCVAGSFPQVEGLEPVRSLLQEIGFKVPVWVDTSGSSLLAASKVTGPSLKINLFEANELLGSGIEKPQGRERDQALAAADALGSDGRRVLVTAGRAGAASYTDSGLRWCDSPVIEVRNPTASGDAFMAGYLCAGQASLAGIEDPLRSAVLAGAVNAQSWGPSASPEAVLDLYQPASD